MGLYAIKAQAYIAGKVEAYALEGQSLPRHEGAKREQKHVVLHPQGRTCSVPTGGPFVAIVKMGRVNFLVTTPFPACFGVVSMNFGAMKT